MTKRDRPAEVTEEMVDAAVPILRRAYAPSGEPIEALRRTVREILEEALSRCAHVGGA
jgi:hypothetical protein